MTIPDEAVEAAAKEAYGHPWDRAPEWAKEEARRVAREHLEAAAPFIAAQALRDATEDLYSYRNSITTMEGAVVWLERRADKLTPNDSE